MRTCTSGGYQNLYVGYDKSRLIDRILIFGWGLITYIAVYMAQVIYAGSPGFGLDDAYIHSAVAKSLVKYHIWGINGEFVSVSTSPLWTLLIVPLEYLGLLQPLYVQLLSLTMNLISAHLIFAIVLKLTGLRFLALLSSVAFLTAPLTLWGTVSGLEIPLSSVLLSYYIYSLLTYSNLKKQGLIAGLLVLTRPEFIVLALLHLIWLVVSKKKNLAFHYLVWIVILLTPYVYLNLRSHGTVFPTPSYAKTILRDVGIFSCGNKNAPYMCIFDHLFIEPIQQLVGAFNKLSLDLVWCILFFGSLFFAFGNEVGEVKLLACSCIALLFAQGVFAPSEKLANYFGRYFSIYLPLIYTLGSYLWYRLNNSSVILALMWIYSLTYSMPKTLYTVGASVESTNALYVEMPKWVARNIPKDAVIATNDIGGLAYFTENRLIDIMGLGSPRIWSFKKQDLRNFNNPRLPEIITQLLKITGSDYAVLNLRRYRFAKNHPCYELLRKFSERYEHGRLISPIGVFEFKCKG
ncbi:MAG: hypothetical protein QXL01_05280 [Thermoplasmatales archaeon]